MDNLSQPTAYPPGVPAPHQPYGMASAPAMPPQKFRFLVFGIPYAVVNACVVGLMLLTVLFFSSGFESGMKASLYDVIYTMVIALAVTIVAWAAVSALASVFCITGRVLGWWIGFIHATLALLFFVVVIAFAVANENAEASRVAGPLVLVVAYTGLFALGLIDLNRYRAHRDARETAEFSAQRAEASTAWASAAAPPALRKQAVAQPVRAPRPDNSAAMQDAIQ